MPNITQAKAVVAEIANQLIGAQYFPAYIVSEDGTDSRNVRLTADNVDEYNAAILTDVGKVLSAYTPAREIVYNTLIDQITKIVIDTKEFVLDLPDIYRDEDEFGMIREVVEIGIADFYDDPMWEDQSQNNYGDPTRTAGSMSGHAVGKEYAQKIAEMRNATYMPKIRNKVYGEGKACMIAISIFRNQLFSAVRSWEEIDRLISGMMLSVRNALHTRAYGTAMAAIGTAIMEAAITGNAYNLLDEAIRAGVVANTVTHASEVMNDYDFQKFALEFMANTKDQMAAVNAYYNDHYLPTQTAREDNRLILLAQWANKLKFGVRADTFHEELLGIGEYKKVPDWQGNNISSATLAGNAGQMKDSNGSPVVPYSWDSISTVKITLDDVVFRKLRDAGFDTTAVSAWRRSNKFVMPNVIGFMYDKWAIGMTLNKENVFSDIQNPVDGKTNTFFHGLFNIAVNSSKNKAVFYVKGSEDEWPVNSTRSEGSMNGEGVVQEEVKETKTTKK